ncbi:tetratricopeptide repeat protein [Caballeronia zhejiangensis]|uniref:tetratricopeptide repeat protein n=1 Tax=Caballeronia zhejiangensis TaxID=871203 RepID=UPI00158E1325|nr:tetratricopeptide repeat protein [Caballeronia zhejiangensis]
MEAMIFDELALVRAVHLFERVNAPARVEALARAWHEHQPSSASAHGALALAALLADDQEEARARVERALQMDENCALAWYVRARLHMVDAQTQPAIICLEQSLILQPYDGDALRLLATLLLRVGRLSKAQDALARLDACGQALAEDLALLAELTIHTETDSGAVQRASTLLKRAGKLDPTCAVSWAVQGELLARAGRLVEAQNALLHASVLIPGNPTFLLRRAVLALQLGEPTVAITLAQRVMTLQPENTQAGETLVDALLSVNRLDDALRASERIAPEHETEAIFLQRVRLFAHAQRYADVARALDRAPDRIKHHELAALRAYIALLAERPVEALKVWDETYLRSRPDHVRAASPGGVTIAVESLLVALPLLRFVRIMRSKGYQVELVANDEVASVLKRVAGVSAVMTDSPSERRALPVQCLPLLAGSALELPLFDEPYLRDEPAHHMRSLSQPDARRPTVLLGLVDSNEDLLDALAERFVRWNWRVVSLRPVSRWRDRYPDLHYEVLEPNSLRELLNLTLAMDHAIAGDDLIAHIRGASGHECDVFLPPVHDPIWGRRTPSTWYPSVHLHRCQSNGAWQAALGSFDARRASKGLSA